MRENGRCGFEMSFPAFIEVGRRPLGKIGNKANDREDALDPHAFRIEKEKEVRMRRVTNA